MSEIIPRFSDKVNCVAAGCRMLKFISNLKRRNADAICQKFLPDNIAILPFPCQHA